MKFLIVLILLSTIVLAQYSSLPSTSYSLTLKDKETKKLLSITATINIFDADGKLFVAKETNNGIVDIEDMPRGKYLAITEAEGYETTRKNFSVIPAAAKPMETLIMLESISEEDEEFEEEKVIQRPIIQPLQLQPPCAGCDYNKRCLPYTTRIVDEGKYLYCETDGTIQQQKQMKTSCQNNYECITNSCLDNACVDIQQRVEQLEKELQEQHSIIQKILDFFKGWFG